MKRAEEGVGRGLGMCRCDHAIGYERTTQNVQEMCFASLMTSARVLDKGILV